MRLHYLAGDRTTALRQYKRCVATLEEDLGVEPSMSTRILYEQICNDRLDGRPPMSGSGEHPVAKPANAMPETHNGPLVELLEHLKKAQA
jgi:DNA-binding SARP family transcriptional activator